MLESGELQFNPHITEGLKSMPQALVDIFTSQAKGPRIVSVHPDVAG